MKNFTFCSLTIVKIFLFALTSSGQTQFNTISSPGNNEPNLVVTDTGYVILQQGNPQGNSLSKIFFDSQGTYLKTDTIELDFFYEDCKSCLELFGSGYVKAGTFFFSDSALTSLMLFDSNLDTVSTTTYSLFNEFTSDAFGLTVIDSNYIIVVGQYLKRSTFTDWMFMVMFDDSLNVVWEKSYQISGWNQPGGLTATNVVRTSDGGFMIGGYSEINQINLLSGIILKTDSLGNEEWRESLNAQEANKEVLLHDLNNGYTLFATAKCDERDSISNDLICQPRIGLIDYNRSILMDKVSGSKGLNLTVEFFKKTLDYNYIIGGYSQSLILASYALKVTGSGDSLWFRKLSYNNHKFPDIGYMQWVSTTNDSGFAFAGYFIDQGPGGNGANAWLVKTDKYGCDVAGCQNIGIGTFHENDTEFSIFPNPAKDEINISTATSTFSFRIYSIIGEKVLEGESLKAKKEIDVSNLPTGTYLIWINGLDTWSAKFLVIK